MVKATDVKWFLDSLEDDLHDQELERDEYELDFYWDTSDVRVALLGVPEFYDIDRTFRREAFESEGTLIRSLAAAGWLGTIRMMQPHQAELLRQIESGFGSRGDLMPPGGLTQFVSEAGLTIQSDLDVGAIPNMHQNQVEALVRDQAGKAPTLFKVVQCARGNWKTRLAAWVGKEGIIKFEDQRIDFRSVVSRKEFAVIRGAFDETRPQSPVNNFADAFAICILAERVRAFSEGRERRVPRFFASSSLYGSILAKTKMAGLLQYRYQDRTVSVLRRADYYWLRASLHPPKELRTPQYEEQLRSLFAIHAQVKEVADARKPLDHEALRSLPPADPPLEKVVQDLRNFWFLENVWLQFAGKTALIAAVREHVETAKQLLESRSFLEGVEQAIDRTKTDLAKNSADFQWISRMLRDLEGAIARVQPHYIGAAPIDRFRTGGLLRFGFPEHLRPRIEAWLDSLLGGEREERENARHQLLVLSRNVKEEENDIDNDAMIVAAVMWVLEMYQWLVGTELLTPALQCRNDSLKVIGAAARLRLLRGDAAIRQSLRELETEYNGATQAAKKFDLAVALGYLYFHFWEWQRSKLPEKSGESATAAIRFAEAAAFGLPDGRPEKKAYAWNQYLYYSCVGHAITPGDQDKMKKAVDNLIALRGNPSVWQYRFDDTLGQYYRWRAEFSPSERGWWLKKASEAVHRAWTDAHGDPEILRHQEELDLMVHTESAMPRLD